MRSSVSILGGRPPLSRRAIADCVVSHRDASSVCESPSSRRRSATCDAIEAKSQPSSAPARCRRSRSTGADLPPFDRDTSSRPPRGGVRSGEKRAIPAERREQRVDVLVDVVEVQRDPELVLPGGDDDAVRGERLDELADV